MPLQSPPCFAGHDTAPSGKAAASMRRSASTATGSRTPCLRQLTTAVALALAISPGAGHSATLKWVGDLGAQWKANIIFPFANTNWDTNTLPANGDSLEFSGNSTLANSNDFVGLGINDLKFGATAGAYVLGGNALTITGSVTNQSLQKQTVNMAVNVGSTNRTWSGGTSGLTFNGAFTLGNNALTLANKTAVDNATLDFTVGDTTAQVASLTLLSASGLRNINGYVGRATGATGTATLGGTNTFWFNSGELRVGDYGTGAVSVSGGATLTSGSATLAAGIHAPTRRQSSGTVTITDNGSLWSIANELTIGNLGSGVLNIQNGGSVSSKTVALGTGYDAASLLGGTGNVSIVGAGSNWAITGLLSIGSVTSGSVSVQAGGTLNSLNADLGVSGALPFGGFNSNGNAILDGAGTSWTVGSQLRVGVSGNGSVIVRNGSKLTSLSAILGAEANVDPFNGSRSGGSASVLVTGAGSSWATSTLVIGRTLPGTLTIEKGGTVQSSTSEIGGWRTYSIGGFGVDPQLVGVQGSGTVVVTDPGSSWDAGSLYVGRGGIGTLTVQAGGKLLSSGTAAIGAGAVQWAPVTPCDTLFLGVACSTGFVQSGNGSVTLTGLQTSWIHAGRLDLGNGGTGGLVIQNAARFESGNAIVGAEAVFVDPLNGNQAGSRGSGSVTVSNATWHNTGWLVVGYGGDGQMRIESGGSVVNFDTAIGTGYGDSGVFCPFGCGSASISHVGSGIVVVTGLQSQWQIDGTLQVGVNSGSGRITIGDGASLVVNGTMSVGSAGSFVELAGGQLTAQRIQSSVTDALHWTGGTLSVSGNAGWSLTDVGLQAQNVSTGMTLDVAKSLTIGSGRSLQLGGGTLKADALNRSGGSFTWTNGTLLLGTLDWGAIVSAGTTLGAGMTLNVARTLRIGPGATLTRAGGSVTIGNLELAGGTLDAGTGSLDLASIGPVTGHGTIKGSILGGPNASIIASGGTLRLGDASRSAAFDFGGTLSVNANDVVLLSADTARLGASTDLAPGGRLRSEGATIVLPQAAALTFSGNATVDAPFQHAGTIVGTNGTLTFLQSVAGAGQFAGNIAFQSGYSPGNSPALIGFGGHDVTFGTDAVLTMEIFGSVPGTEHDRLADIGLLSFTGRLRLVFGNGHVPSMGSSFALLGFQQFSGSLAPERIEVTGIDRTLLDFSHLPTDGTLSVAAVPEAETHAMLLAGLGLIGLHLRRRCRMQRRTSIAGPAQSRPALDREGVRT